MNKTKSTVRAFDLLKYWFAVLSAMMLLISMPASATNLDQLVSDGELKLNVEIKAQDSRDKAETNRQTATIKREETKSKERIAKSKNNKPSAK